MWGRFVTCQNFWQVANLPHIAIQHSQKYQAMLSSLL